MTIYTAEEAYQRILEYFKGDELAARVWVNKYALKDSNANIYEATPDDMLIANTKDKAENAACEEGVFPVDRPPVLEAEIVLFQNNKDKWIAFTGLVDGKPYEIFTGLADDEDGILIPRWVNDGLIIKNREGDGPSRYDFKYENRYGHKTTIEGLSYKFNPEYWNYAKLISGTQRHGMPIEKVVDLVGSLQLDESINTWKNGVARALKKYIPDGTEVETQVCQNCNSTNLQYQEGCLTCKDCGSSKCG